MHNPWEYNFANTDNVFQADKLKTVSCTPGDAVACGWPLKEPWVHFNGGLGGVNQRSTTWANFESFFKGQEESTAEQNSKHFR